MSADSIDSSKPTLSEEELKMWERERAAFLNHPVFGEAFYESYNKKIAALVRPGCRDWQRIAPTNRFESAFEFLFDRLLSVEGFRNVAVKHRGSKSSLSFYVFMNNRVDLVLSEWASARRDEPFKTEKPDERIDQTAVDKSTSSDFPFQKLSLRIESLNKKHQATLLLWIWPLPSFPESWREKFEPIILDVGEASRLTRAEVKRRLQEVMQKRTPKSEDAFLQVQARQCLHFEKSKHFDSCKRQVFMELKRLEGVNEYIPGLDVEAELKCDCYRAVKQSEEADVHALYDDDAIYEKLRSGRRRLKNRTLWFRKRFAHCCFKQKYHRRVWLNASLQLLVQESVDGPMSHAEIGYILNCPENTSASNLRRARQALLGQTDSGDLDETLGSDSDSSQAQKAALDAKKTDFKNELDNGQLDAFVCENLQ